MPRKERPDGDPLWYRDAILYELRVRSFFDSDGDGIGDLRGLTQKLDYLQDLGVTTLWLLPFNPSPLRDDGYDIADHTAVDPACGNLQDFKVFLREAHRRDLRVVTELVLNHTSDQHPWFQRARRAAPGTRERDFYVWSDTPDRYSQTRIIFRDFESSNWTWDPVAKAYFWHRFYSHQPDLNYDSPDVRKAIFQVVDFWLGLGVDGFRLDAIPYLYEREGTTCENLPETHAFLKSLRHHVNRKFPDRMLLAEANLWPEEAVAYFGDGDECHMAFHFPIMSRLFMALRMEDRFPVSDILQQTPPIPDTCQWALFLRNHDELTLETVTDEERDYMYRFYAQDAQARINLGIRRRLAPLLGNARRRIELMNALLLSLPGTPVIYYGDEIGMGDNIYLGDRNGVRTPMQWSADRNAGFSRANPQRLLLPVITDPEYHYETVNVEAHQNNLQSLLWWTKRLIALRKRYRAFSRGSLEFLHPTNRRVLAFVRSWEDEHVLVVANLSRFPQYAELDLSRFRGRVAVELFGRSEFPAIGEDPYLLTLGPHTFYGFALEPQRARRRLALAREEGNGRGGETAERALPALTVKGSWENVLEGAGKQALETLLAPYVASRPWFESRGRAISTVRMVDRAPISGALPRGAEGPRVAPAALPHLAILRVEHSAGAADTYVLGLAFAYGEDMEHILRHSPGSVIARLDVRGADGETRGVLVDALEQREIWQGLLEVIARGRPLATSDGEITPSADSAFVRLRGDATTPVELREFRADGGRPSVRLGERFTLRLYRRLPEGTSLELEIGRHLSARGSLPEIASLVGALEYRSGTSEPRTLAVLQEHVPNRGSAWDFTLEEVERYFERALARHAGTGEIPGPEEFPLQLSTLNPPRLADETVGAYLEAARLIGRHTARLHMALASGSDDVDFTPEPFSPYYQRSLYQYLRSLSARVFGLLRARRETLLREAAEITAREDDTEAAVMRAHEGADLQEGVLGAFRSLLEGSLSGARIRIHGHYDLYHLVHTGGDFIVDFAREPLGSLGSGRIKRSALVDVAGMLRSLHAAVWTPLSGKIPESVVRPTDVAVLKPWARYWYAWVGAAFLRAYLEEAGAAEFLPSSREELDLLLRTYLLETSLYDLERALESDAGGETIPLLAIREWLGSNAGDVSDRTGPDAEGRGDAAVGLPETEDSQ